MPKSTSRFSTLEPPLSLSLSLSFNLGKSSRLSLLISVDTLLSPPNLWLGLRTDLLWSRCPSDTRGLEDCVHLCCLLVPLFSLDQRANVAWYDWEEIPVGDPAVNSLLVHCTLNIFRCKIQPTVIFKVWQQNQLKITTTLLPLRMISQIPEESSRSAQKFYRVVCLLFRSFMWTATTVKPWHRLALAHRLHWSSLARFHAFRACGTQMRKISEDVTAWSICFILQNKSVKACVCDKLERKYFVRD